MSVKLTSALALVSDATGTTIAYELGSRQSCFAGAPREEAKDIFVRTGFPRAAATLDVTAEVTFSEAVSRKSAAFCKRYGAQGELVVTKVHAEAGHAKAFLVEQVTKLPGERQPRRTPGARVFLHGDVAYAAPPIEGPEIPACASVARDLAAVANWLRDHADETAMSRALSTAYPEGGAVPWIARGTYIAAEGRPGTARLLRLVDEIRAAYYDDATRCGVRVSAIPIKSGEKQSVEALVDALLDDLGSKVGTLVAQMADEASRTNVKENTFVKRRDEARAILDAIAESETFLGPAVEKLREMASGVAEAYNRKISGADLELPEWAQDMAGQDEDSAFVAAALAAESKGEAPAAQPEPEAPAAQPEPEAPAAQPEPEAPAAQPEPESDPFAI